MSWQSINPFMPSRISLQASGSNVYLNGSNLNIEISGGSSSANWYNYPALCNVDLNNNNINNVNNLSVASIQGTGDPISLNTSLLCYRGLDLQAQSIENVGNINLYSINDVPYVPGGSASNWYNYPALNNVDLCNYNINNVANLTVASIQSTGGPIIVNNSIDMLHYNGINKVDYLRTNSVFFYRTAPDYTNESYLSMYEDASNYYLSLDSINFLSYNVPGGRFSFENGNTINLYAACNIAPNIVFCDAESNVGRLSFENTLLFNGTPLVSAWADYIPADVHFTNVWASNIVPTTIQLKQREYDYSAEVVQFYNVENTFIGRLGVNFNFVSLDFLEGNTFIVNAPTQFNSGITADLDMSSNSIRNVNELQLGKSYYSIPGTPDFVNVRWWENGYLSYSFNDSDYYAVAGDWSKFTSSQDVDMGGYSITNCAKFFINSTQQPFTQFGVITVATLIDDTSGFPYDVADLTSIGFSDVSLPNAYPDTSYIVQLTAMSVYTKCWFEIRDSSSFRVYGRTGCDYAWTAMGLL